MPLTVQLPLHTCPFRLRLCARRAGIFQVDSTYVENIAFGSTGKKILALAVSTVSYASPDARATCGNDLRGVLPSRSCVVEGQARHYECDAFVLPRVGGIGDGEIHREPQLDCRFDAARTARHHVRALRGATSPNGNKSPLRLCTGRVTQRGR